MAKTRCLNAKAFKLIKDTVKEHGEIVVYFEFNRWGCSSLRRRKITSSGKCLVSYYSESKAIWSKYEKSCFMEKARPFAGLLCLMNRMAKHDYTIITPIRIEHGRGSNKKRIEL